MVTRSGTPAPRRNAFGRTLIALLALPLACPTAMLTAAPVRADDGAAHRITYTVSSEDALDADVYFRDVDPPSWADYSHNPYLFSPLNEATLEPGRPWVREVTLADPDRWAMVAVSRTSTQVTGVIRCELAVDGIVVDTAEGNAGAVCSLRHW